jgi:hypothetical protein
MGRFAVWRRRGSESKNNEGDGVNPTPSFFLLLPLKLSYLLNFHRNHIHPQRFPSHCA